MRSDTFNTRDRFFIVKQLTDHFQRVFFLFSVFSTCLLQDYEERIASLQEQVERNSMMSSMIRFDVDGEDDDECKMSYCEFNNLIYLFVQLSLIPFCDFFTTDICIISFYVYCHLEHNLLHTFKLLYEIV